MVVSRNDIKRKRKDSDTTVDTLPESPKRTKVHAQRKFAQGSNVSSPVITPVKELEREKIKTTTTDVLQTTTELLPIKRPNTEDFLTFLCFRGTSILPANLNFFGSANSPSASNNETTTTKTNAASATVTKQDQDNTTERPFIAFGVRKRADPFVSNKLEKKRRHAIALQALRRKYQEQRMAKIRAVTIEKMSEGIKIKSKNLVRTRSITRQQETDVSQKRKIKVVTKRVKITTRTTVKRPILKQKMCLRSRGRMIPRELTASPVKKPTKKIPPAPAPVKKQVKPTTKVQPAKLESAKVEPTNIPSIKQDSSSEFSSDDDQPLVKTIKKPIPTTKKIPPKVIKKTQPSPKKANLIRLTRSSQSSIRSSQSSIRLESHITQQRPSRKTKEAAALYMELLGRKLVNDAEIDDEDNASIDSFPELPNVRRTEQRENELKANVKTQSPITISKINTRATIKSEKNKEKIAEKEKIEKINKFVKSRLIKKIDTESLVEKTVELVEKKTKKILRSQVDKTIKTTTTKVDKNTDQFSDSDEEPLAKLTTQKKIIKPVKKPTTTDVKINSGKKNETTTTTKTIKSTAIKREPKLEQKSDLNDFRVKIESDDDKPIKMESKCSHIIPEIAPPSADLLCKDIGRRFGKGKVNMSTEQIEKWLKDSALAGECSKKDVFEKKYEDDILKYDEKDDCKSEISSIDTTKKTPSNTTTPIVNSDVKHTKVSPLSEQSIKTSVTPIINKIPANERKYIFQQRRSILSKDKKEISPNNKAFSPDNESSVYAFEAEMETPVNTPFRSHVRRPSSTATSRSEDDACKMEEEEKRKSHDGKFRLPAVVKQALVKNKQEMSLTLSAEDINNSASIAVQVNLDSDAGFTESSMECSTQTDAGDDEPDGHLFYIPLQPGNKTVTKQQLIQGVAVKLGTETSDGLNQRVVMRAKLVTQPALLGQQKPLAQTTLMYPPVGTVQPTYRPRPLSEPSKINPRPEPKILNENVITIPSSPSASSSSSAKIYKRPLKSRARSLDVCVPVNSSEFPGLNNPAQLVEAPVFHPSEREFQDPIEFIEKIRPHAEKFGICRIVPPANFKPECKVSDDMRFTAYNQYIHKMLHRWGPNFKEFMAIKKYLATQSITFTHPPWIGGMEIDLPRLYQTVQSLGGLKEVIEKKRWPRVAEGMKIPKSAQDRVTKLDDIYCKYLLPYDTLSPAEREKLFDEVETEWAKRESRNLSKQTTNVSVTTSNESDSESGDDEAEECTVKGRNMALNAFYRIARNTMSMWFKSTEPSAHEVEQEFWKHVTTRQNHLCVHSGSIDSSGWGYGFACSKNSPFARHPWNLKILTNNSGSVLRSMGPIMGVTVPTLHVGMVFSACCWYRDPHGLPWIEYLHTGANKIWYGIPDTYSDKFQSALTKLVPSYCRKKTLWLTSDTAMVPPSMLVQNGVSLCRTVQEPGQFIVVFPKAFTSSICSGYVVSESVYFAPSNWLASADQAFKDIRDSCESSMFSLERLILSIASDARSNSEVLRLVLPTVQALKQREQTGRKKLEGLGLKTNERLPMPGGSSSARKKRKIHEDDGEYECEICRTNLYISLVIDSHEEGVYCLDHAIEHIKSKPDQLKYCKLMFTYDTQDFDALIEKIKLNIETKSQMKRPARFYKTLSSSSIK